ncbi:hypothetical protein LTR10_010299 [Elasticomyces elasticus]|nr:hypothetical protein LTR10_010299 [Elasticomyces elasticus]KAK4972204.1 hypothetical protein LTR42_006710 [Elasticomyces elasticus]
MPPKRKAAPAASQPVVSSTRTTGRKRRHSDAASVASNASEIVTAPVKRRKAGRGKTAASIAEEEDLQLSAHHEDALHSQLGGDATYERDMSAGAEAAEESIEVRKHVHFGGASSPAERSTTTANLTPHPRKFETLTRRITMSPSVGISTRAGSTRSGTATRMSLPPVWGGEAGESTQIIKNMHFKTMDSVVDERVKRLRRSLEQLSRDGNGAGVRAESTRMRELVQQLHLDLESLRDIDTEESQQRAVQLEQNIASAQQELDAYNGEYGLLDETILVLDRQEAVGEASYPALPATAFGSSLNGGSESKSIFRESTSRLSLDAKLSADFALERESFKDAIQVFAKEAADAKATLSALIIQIQALGFGDSPDNILESIRESFANVRELFDSELPDTLPEDATTQDIIETLIANVREFTNRLRLQDQDIREKNDLVTELSGEVDKLLDHLAAAKIRYESLEKRFTELDKERDQEIREREQAEEDLVEADKEIEQLKAELALKTQERESLDLNNGDLLKDIEALKVSLDKYRSEENRLSELINSMELNYKETIKKMNLEREQTMQELEDRLDEETRLRGEAEKQADERQTEITALDIQFEQVSTERDALRDELAVATAELVEEKADRIVTESTLEEKNVEIDGLTARVDLLEEQLDEMTVKLEELRTLNEAATRQREAAEQDLDDRNAEVDELTQRLDTQGKEANVLRMKLFEVQQDNEKAVRDLQKLMSDQDNKYQVDIAAEVARREAADDMAAERANIILELETRLEEVELQMRADVLERDNRIAELEAELVERNTEIEGLNMDLRSVETDLENVRTEKDDQIEELEASILLLKQTVITHETTILLMQQEATNDTTLHNSEIEDRNAKIALLHAQVTELTANVRDLEKQRNGLEKRVEDEAEAMLELSNQKEDEIDDYKKQLRDKQEKILVVEQKAVEADRAWEEVLAARDDEIEELKKSATSSGEVVVTLTTDFEAMRQQLRDHVAYTNTAIEKLEASVLTAKTVADDEGAAVKTRGLAMLAEIETYDLVGKVEFHRTTTQSESSSVKKGRGRKTKRVMDSGIGMDLA